MSWWVQHLSEVILWSLTNNMNVKKLNMIQILNCNASCSFQRPLLNFTCWWIWVFESSCLLLYTHIKLVSYWRDPVYRRNSELTLDRIHALHAALFIVLSYCSPSSISSPHSLFGDDAPALFCRVHVFRCLNLLTFAFWLWHCQNTPHIIYICMHFCGWLSSIADFGTGGTGSYPPVHSR